MEHIAVANGRTKEHTTQEARCNPPNWGLAPVEVSPAGWLWLLVARRRRRKKKQRALCVCKKIVYREIRTRGLRVARPAPSPLRYSGVVTTMCFNVLEQRTFISRGRRSVTATYADATHATLRPRWLHPPPAPHPRSFPPCTAAPRRRRTAAYAAFRNPQLATSSVFAEAFAAAAGGFFGGSGQQRAHRPPRWVVFWDTGQGNSEGGKKGGNRPRAFSRSCFARTTPPS